MTDEIKSCPDCTELRRRLKHVEEWYATRFERLRQWVKTLPEEEAHHYHAIVANGVAEPFEPPTYAQQMNILKYELEEARAEIQRLKEADQALRSSVREKLQGLQGLQQERKEKSELLLKIKRQDDKELRSAFSELQKAIKRDGDPELRAAFRIFWKVVWKIIDKWQEVKEVP